MIGGFDCHFNCGWNHLGDGDTHLLRDGSISWAETRTKQMKRKKYKWIYVTGWKLTEGDLKWSLIRFHDLRFCLPVTSCFLLPLVSLLAGAWRCLVSQKTESQEGKPDEQESARRMNPTSSASIFLGIYYKLVENLHLPPQLHIKELQYPSEVEKINSKWDLKMMEY